MRHIVSKLLGQVAGNKRNKRRMKKVYNTLNSIQRGKFNKNLKLFIQERNKRNESINSSR